MLNEEANILENRLYGGHGVIEVPFTSRGSKVGLIKRCNGNNCEILVTISDVCSVSWKTSNCTCGNSTIARNQDNILLTEGSD